MPSRTRRKKTTPGAATIAEARRIFGEVSAAEHAPDPKHADPAFEANLPRPTQGELDQLADRLVERRRKRLTGR